MALDKNKTAKPSLKERRANAQQPPSLNQASAQVKTLAPGLADGPIALSNRTPTDVYDRVPKLPCPQCGKVISLSLSDLLHMQGITCPHCLLQLTMDRNASGSAIEHMQHFYVAMKDVKMGG